MSLKRKCSAVVFKNSIISLNFDSHYLLLFVCFFLGIFCRWKITFSREFDDFVQYFCCSKPFCQMYSVNTIHVDKNVPSCIYEFQSSSMVLKKIFQRIFQRIFKIFVEIGKSLQRRGWASNTCAQYTQIRIYMLVGLSSNCQLYSNMWLK